MLTCCLYYKHCYSSKSMTLEIVNEVIYTINMIKFIIDDYKHILIVNDTTRAML
jgi:hypothetical protein